MTETAGPRIVSSEPAPVIEKGQLVLVSIPGLGYQDALAEILETGKPLPGASEIFILADKRHPDVASGNHSRMLPNRALKLVELKKDVIEGLAELRRKYGLTFLPTRSLVRTGQGWGWKKSAKEDTGDG